MRENIDPMVAGAFAILVTAGLLLFLLHFQVRLHSMSNDRNADRIRLIFSERAVPETPSKDSDTEATPEPIRHSTRNAPPRPAPGAMSATDADAHAHERRAPLNLAIGEAEASFAHDPLRRVPILAEQPQARLKVRMQDRSIGGWLARKTRFNTCAELRRALIEAPGSSEVIINTMIDRGCPL